MKGIFTSLILNTSRDVVKPKEELINGEKPSFLD